MSVEDNKDRLQYWSKRWSENRIGWHQPQVNKFLLKYFATVTGEEIPSEELAQDSQKFIDNSKKTWFLPLCGKSLDIPFLMKLGYRIFGVEGCKKAIDELSQENNLNLIYDETTCCFTGAEGRLIIYCGDLFTCPLDRFGRFDYVWDRGSFIAIDYSDRNTYVNLMKNTLKGQKIVYLLETVVYDKSKDPGPPRSVSDDDMKMFFAGWTNVKFLETTPLPETHRLTKIPNIGEVVAKIYLLNVN